MAKPRALKPGSTVRIVTPASPLTMEKISFAISLMEGWGLKVEFGKHTFDADHHLAGSDSDRAQDQTDAFLDDNVDMVLCSRGGYGCARLFPFLDLNRLASSNKLFGGFSDITTLHLAFNQLGLPTLHCPMPLTLSVPRADWVIESFRAAIFGENPIPVAADKGKTVVGGIAEGITTGGCLCLLTDSIGTPFPLSCEDKIVIIEDVDEAPHRIDAMLTHLLNEGSIKRAAGIVVGEMTRTDDRTDEGIGGKPWKEILRERLGHLGIPMIVDFPLGHAPQMLSLPLGIRARLDASQGTLTYTESLCEN